jgi:hypothetical protein
MAYEIAHKSQSECLIKYVVDENSGNNFWLELLIVAFVLLALASAVELLIIIIGFAITASVLVKAKPRRATFEIELNRKKNLVSIKSNKPGVAALRTYPLNNFKGFGLVERPRSKKKKNGPLADLFLEFDDAIDAKSISAKNSLLNQGELKTEPDGEIFWRVPIHKIKHHTTIKNAEKTIASVDAWLGPKAIEKQTNEPPVIMRDLRELEDGEPLG